MHKAEELPYALDEGLFDEHSRLLINIILIRLVVHSGQSLLQVAVVQVVWHLRRDYLALDVDNVFACRDVSLILNTGEHLEVKGQLLHQQRQL